MALKITIVICATIVIICALDTFKKNGGNRNG